MNTEMMTVESLPIWLRAWEPGSSIQLEDFLASRVVFYPGSGTDGQPVEFFGSKHAAHCFAYVDYGVAKNHVLGELGETGHPFKGYQRLGRTDLRECDLTPAGWVPHVQADDAARGPFEPVAPYAFIEVLERRADFDDTHGPLRLAILFICADGIAAYDALFCQGRAKAPFALVLQDHGWGGNWTRFGRGGRLEQLASTMAQLPGLLLVAENTDVWDGYSSNEGTTGKGGGVHGFRRQLWRRDIQVNGETVSRPSPLARRRETSPSLEGRLLPSESLVHQVFELLRDHCTDGNHGQALFLQQCNAVLRGTALDAGQSAAASWSRSWDKPLYANQLARRATEVADRIRRTPELFADPLRLPDDPACLRGLRAPQLKLDRVRRLGGSWAELHRLHQSIATVAQRLIATESLSEAANETRRLLGVPGFRTRNTTGTLFDALTAVDGIGPITSLHLLADLGYPVYKPDRWVVRFAAADPSCRRQLQRHLQSECDLDRLDASFLLRHLDLVCLAIDSLTASFTHYPTPVGIEMSAADFRAYRFVDLMVAKFGMKPEESFGLAISGRDWLLAAAPAEAGRYSTLLQIAREMESTVRVRGEFGPHPPNGRSAQVA